MGYLTKLTEGAVALSTLLLWTVKQERIIVLSETELRCHYFGQEENLQIAQFLG